MAGRTRSDRLDHGAPPTNLVLVGYNLILYYCTVGAPERSFFDVGVSCRAGRATHQNQRVRTAHDENSFSGRRMQSYVYASWRNQTVE